MATFTEMLEEVVDVCNVNSDQASVRIGRSLNNKYREICSEFGIDQTIAQTTATTSATIGNRLLTFGPTPTPVTKLLLVYDASAAPTIRILDEISVVQMRDRLAFSGDHPEEYAVWAVGARSVTLLLDSTPVTAYTLTADVLTTATRLSGMLIPAFHEAYHDILVHHAMSIEYEKKGNTVLSKKHEDKATDRLKDYRFFLSRSNTKTLVAGMTDRVIRRRPLQAV